MDERHVSNSAQETLALGRKLGQSLKSGDIVALYGGLGAGKTVFAKGIASGLGIEEEVVSPTFTLLRQYEGRLPLYHFDLYRIEEEEELYHIGFYEYITDGGVCVIEWADNAAGIPPCIRVNFEGSGSDRRIITISGAEGTS